MIAVAGASGNIGGRVAETLLSKGEQVRALGRSQQKLERLGRQGAEVFVADFKDAGLARAAFAGAEAALVLLPDDVTDPEFTANRSKMARTIADSLREGHVGHVVALSSIGAENKDGPGPLAGLWEFEQLLFGLDGSSVLVLRYGWRMENVLAGLPFVKDQKMNGGVFKADLKIPMTATQDVAAEASERLALRDFSGHAARALLGPKDTSMTELTRAIGERLGIPDMPYLEFPPAGLTQALIGAGMSPDAAQAVTDLQVGFNEGRIDPGPRSAETSAPTTLEQFLDSALA